MKHIGHGYAQSFALGEGQPTVMIVPPIPATLQTTLHQENSID